MERLFDTHSIRASHELPPMWTMTTLDEGGLPAPERVLVPGVWESVPRLKSYHGRALYEQQIACEGNVRLWFGGVSFRAKVWLDSQLIVTHYGAYTGFGTVVRAVPRGVHTLRVEVDNRFGDDSALHVPNDYYAYGGINRPVLIERLHDAYITSLHVTPVLRDGVWSAKADVRVCNLAGTAAEYTLRLELAGQTAECPITLQPDEERAFSMELRCPNARVWSVEEPNLTGVRAILLRDGEPVDDLIDRFGFREVKVDGDRILLNGAPIRLKGFNRHEDFNDFGLSAPVEAMLRDLQLMRDIGANCVRTCHYPNDPRFLDLCDELGMLVWEEAHSRGLSEKQMRHPAFMEQLHQCVREMQEQHHNHPCIFIWGCLNECSDDTEYGADCFRKTFALLHELDASRPMTAALLERAGGRVFDASDVVSINIYPSWYHATPVGEAFEKKLREIEAHGGAGKPVIVSEIGAGAIYGYHDPLGEAKWSEERQCTALREQIEQVLTNERCSGVFLWQFADVRVDESWFSSRPRTFNNKGVVDEYRRPKLSYALVRELFHRL